MLFGHILYAYCRSNDGLKNSLASMPLLLRAIRQRFIDAALKCLPIGKSESRRKAEARDEKKDRNTERNGICE